MYTYLHPFDRGIQTITRQFASVRATCPARALALGLAGILSFASVADPALGQVDISHGTQVSASDRAQFDALWMSDDAVTQRINDYKDAMKDRQLWVAWDVGGDSEAMVRLYELTADERYLKHLKAIGEVTLKYRDDNNPGSEDNWRCIKCTPPFIDYERGGVQAAWGGASIAGFVSDGGLQPVDVVTSGVFMYPIVAFARLVTESGDATIRATYGDAAVAAANAGIQVFFAFASQLYQATGKGGYVEGTLRRPTLYPTPSQCDAAKAMAIGYAQQFRIEQGAEWLGGQLRAINDARSACLKSKDYAAKPLAYNESGSLMLSLVELWRALDSSLYRDSPLQASYAPLVRQLIPFILARNQRYFANRLQLVDNTAEGKRYAWNYNDDVPDPHIEDAGHANLDMLYVTVLRDSRDRLNAITTPAGEPIPVDDGRIRRFANTFLEEIAQPARIDAGGNVGCEVTGKLVCDKNASDKTYFNSTVDGWVNLAPVDPTVYRLIRDITQRAYVQEVFPNVFTLGQHDMTIANHAQLLANTRYSRDVANLDLTVLAGSPRAAGDPFGWVFAAKDVQDATYRGIDGHVYELWRTTDGRTGYTNLSANAGAPRAASDPKGYEFPALGTHNVAYRATDGHLHVLWWTTGAVGNDDLTALSGAPAPTGNPFPYVSPPFGVQNVVYRGTDAHLHVLFWSTGAVGHDDITQLSSAPAALGDPFGYFITTQGVQNVVYHGVDGHLHGLYWGLGAVGHDDLTALSGAPGPAGDATAYVTSSGLQTVVYRGTDGHIHGLYWTTGAVTHDDLSENGVPGAPLPVGDLDAYFNALDQTNHVVYRTSNGHLHELSWTTGAVSHADLTTLEPGIQSSAGKPSAYVLDPDRTQHVLFRATNGDLHDLTFDTPLTDVILSRAVAYRDSSRAP
jgi:hypothetical protein